MILSWIRETIAIYLLKNREVTSSVSALHNGDGEKKSLLDPRLFGEKKNKQSRARLRLGYYIQEEKEKEIDNGEKKVERKSSLRKKKNRAKKVLLFIKREGAVIIIQFYGQRTKKKEERMIR